ncbi:MAG: phenylalanine--tRNA ligase subunit alpha [Candidatus Marinimicrobia bacterium]|nr:phenylalanine--tRNA ligase subunit alpha [Candidatus Neomarinimicrobiota bacterium]
MSLKDKIGAVRNDFRAALDNFPSDTIKIDELRVRFLGRKGEVAQLFSTMGSVATEERAKAGKLLNDLKIEVQSLFESAVRNVSQNLRKKETDNLDYTLPGVDIPSGSIHPIEQTLTVVKDIFKSIGFSVAYGPEIDDEYHNFEALNIPKHHPARDMQDTFFVEDNAVLRTHTSNVQIHLMENQEPPIRHIVPGRVYRNEAISYKSFCLFHQVEGLYVDKNVSFSELKGTLDYFARRMFGDDVKIRFRPSYFPFTEPSAEVDIWNSERNQWLEILGCGMVNPKVFENVGYDSNIWHGYAFGMGIERIAMLKYKIQDIRHFYRNDIRFLEQF